MDFFTFNNIAILLVGNIIGGFIGVFISKHFKARKQLKYEDTNKAIISNARQELSPHLKLTHKNKRINTLSSTNVVFTNAGNTLLEGDRDFAASDNLHIITDGVLHCYCVKKSNPQNQVEVDTVGSERIDVSFDFLGEKESFELTILHTVLNPRIVAKGTLKNGRLSYLKVELYPWTLLNIEMVLLGVSITSFIIGLVFFSENIKPALTISFLALLVVGLKMGLDFANSQLMKIRNRMKSRNKQPNEQQENSDTFLSITSKTS